jgi:hypothetical protein
VVEVAARAVLKERMFFRHYDDKREVLFAGSEMLSEVLVTEQWLSRQPLSNLIGAL